MACSSDGSDQRKHLQHMRELRRLWFKRASSGPGACPSSGFHLALVMHVRTTYCHDGTRADFSTTLEKAQLFMDMWSIMNWFRFPEFFLL